MTTRPPARDRVLGKALTPIRSDPPSQASGPGAVPPSTPWPAAAEILNERSGDVEPERLLAGAGPSRGRQVTVELEEACCLEYPRLVCLLTVYCGDRDTALDLAQETCARACAHWAIVRRADDRRAWFTTVALNLARSRHRRQLVEHRLTALLGRQRPGTVEPDVAQEVTVRAALARLTPRQRAAVVLRFYEDLDLAQTAVVMRCGQSTVKKLTARALVSLRSSLAADEPFTRARRGCATGDAGGATGGRLDGEIEGGDDDA
jgi:RNA polymerase sigma factor (sigma-70 family)